MAEQGFMKSIRGWFGGGEVIEATASGGTRDPVATIVKKIGLALGVGTSRDFQAPEFDLTQITTAYETEAYVRQAIDKYIESMFKAGWDIVGKNQAAVDYLKLRLNLIAEMSEIPTDQLFIEIAEDLVKYSNSIVLKQRDKQNLIPASGAALTVQGLGGQPAVAGYFPANATTFSLRRDKNGAVKGWQQEVEGADKPVTFKPADVVHIYYKREKGRAFGTPFLLAVLDDIRALRQAEETVLRMIYRNLNPLLHIKVGTEDLPGQQKEIDTVQNAFETMDLEAGFVTSERVEISPVAANQIIDAKEYLKYFEQRVFTGLGVSELMMGRGNTANRSTGDNLSGEFADRVKAFQKVMAIFVDEFIIKELLLEGGFDPVLNPDDNVDFVFKEIDVDAKIKAENHAIFQYEHNAITEDEMRALLGRDPITDRAQMFMNLVTVAVETEKAKVGAQYAPQAAAETGTPATNNKNKPTNQSGTKASPKKENTDYLFRFTQSIEDSFHGSHDAIVKALEGYMATGNKQHMEDLNAIVRRMEEDLVETMGHYLGTDYAAPHVARINRVCSRLHDEVMQAANSFHASQREALVYETVGGIYEVLHSRMQDIAQRAYESYINLGKEAQ